MIPAAKQALVDRALQAAFGTTHLDAIEPLTGGLSTALVFRIVAGGRAALLRVIMRDDAMADPTRTFAMTRAAAAAGLAPEVLYASVEDRVMIGAYVEPHPYPADAGTRLAAAIARIHALPPFEGGPRFPQALGGFIERFRAASPMPEAETAAVFAGYERALAAYPWQASVSSHNDLKPQNTLYDGSRFVFVDWEAGGLNDRYFDLAVAANFFADEDAAMLAAYHGQPPDQQQLARFYLMRQVMHVFYAVVFMGIAMRAGARPDPAMDLPDFRTFHDRLRGRELAMEDAHERLMYGLLHWQKALQQLQGPVFEQALTRA